MGWHWVFWVNVPVGSFVLVLANLCVPKDTRARSSRALDVAGAVTITSALTLVLVAATQDGPLMCSPVFMVSSAAAVVLLCLFVAIERCAEDPLLPLRVLRSRSFLIANLVGMLWSAGTFTGSVTAALYLQQVLSFTPVKVGLAFVPTDLMIALLSGAASAGLVLKWGTRRMLGVGLLLVATGLALMARAPTKGVFPIDVLPAMLLLGLGGGMVATPLMLVGMNDARADQTGLASGLLNTSMVVGSAVGLALLSNGSHVRTELLLRSGNNTMTALNGGYHFAFFVGATFVAAAATLAAFALSGARTGARSKDATSPC